MVRLMQFGRLDAPAGEGFDCNENVAAVKVNGTDHGVPALLPGSKPPSETS
jgi:hypothetical protein